jgi:hypothetical protein
MKAASPWFAILIGCLLSVSGSAANPVDEYVDAYLTMFPSRATANGRYTSDDRLERLDQEHRASWIRFNEDSSLALRKALASDPEPAERIDLELLLRQVQQELLEWRDVDRPRTDPLFWSEILSQSTVYLALRRDRPASVRLGYAADRTDQVPRLVDEALLALGSTAADQVIPERAAAAAERLSALAEFYRSGLPAAEGASPALARRLRRSGNAAARAIDKLAARAKTMAASGRADFRLGDDYQERFQIVTGINTPVRRVLATARRELAERRQEAAAYGRGVWSQFYPDQIAPVDDRQVLRQLFAAIEAARPSSTAELVAQFTADTDAAFAFAADHRLLSLPEPRTLVIGTAPAWLGGQSVGGVYPAGPFQPEAETLFLLPNIPDSAPEAAKARFFSAFNSAFNRMIVAHELVPGHYVQLKIAARQPHPIRSLFGDGVYTEGWGSFCERLMLDLGWGGPPERLAHYKKQLENSARLIADISVHTKGWDQPRLTSFLRDDALIDAQFAANMWQRAVLTSPQLTSYQLGYRDIHALWQDWYLRHADQPPGRFVDAMLSLGAIPVREYREVLLPARTADEHIDDGFDQ